MPITFIPKGGDVLLCDFGPDPLDPATYPLAAGPCSVAPEMIKRRHVMVLAAQGMMVSVLPFSSIEPTIKRNFHDTIAADTYPFFAVGVENWFKGDMVCAVSRDRLSRLWHGGRYQQASLSAADFAKGRRCALHGIALGHLAQHV